MILRRRWRRTMAMWWKGCSHVVGRWHTKASFGWRRSLVVHHRRVWPPLHHRWGHGGHVGVRRSGRHVGRWETLHVLSWGNRRTLEWDYTWPCPKQTSRAGLDVSWRSSWGHDWKTTRWCTGGHTNWVSWRGKTGQSLNLNVFYKRVTV